MTPAICPSARRSRVTALRVGVVQRHGTSRTGAAHLPRIPPKVFHTLMMERTGSLHSPPVEFQPHPSREEHAVNEKVT